MGKIGKVLKPKQHTEKHHKHVAAYEQREMATATQIEEHRKKQQINLKIFTKPQDDCGFVFFA